MSKIELGFFNLPKTNIPEFTPSDNQEIIFPDHEIVDIDIQNINCLNDNSKCKLIEFYKDGLLISVNQKKTSFFSVELNLKEIDEIESLNQGGPNFEEDEELLQKMLANQDN